MPLAPRMTFKGNFDMHELCANGTREQLLEALQHTLYECSKAQATEVAIETYAHNRAVDDIADLVQWFGATLDGDDPTPFETLVALIRERKKVG